MFNLNVTGMSGSTLILPVGNAIVINLTGNLGGGAFTVNTPSATVNNYATNGVITIDDVSGNTWNENASGNTIIFNDPDVGTNLVIGAGQTVAALTLNTRANVTIPSDATVSSLTVETAAAGSTIGNAGTIAKIAGTGSVEVSGGGEVTQTTNPSVTIPTAGPANQLLTKYADLVNSTGVYSASFTWASTNGIGTKLVEKSDRYNYFNDGAYLDITVKEGTDNNVAFDTLFENMTLTTDGGNADSIKGTGGRQAEDWAGTDGQWKTKLKTDDSKAVFYGVRQSGTGTAVGATRTVGFHADDSRNIDLALTPKADIAPGTYTVTIQPKQQTGVTSGENLGDAIVYTFEVTPSLEEKVSPVHRVTVKDAIYNVDQSKVGYSFQFDFKKIDLEGTMNKENDFKVSLLNQADEVIATNTIIKEVSLNRTTTYNGTTTTFYFNGKDQNFNSWHLSGHDGKVTLDTATKVKVEYVKDGARYSKVLDITLPTELN